MEQSHQVLAGVDGSGVVHSHASGYHGGTFDLADDLEELVVGHFAERSTEAPCSGDGS